MHIVQRAIINCRFVKSHRTGTLYSFGNIDLKTWGIVSPKIDFKYRKRLVWGTATVDHIPMMIPKAHIPTAEVRIGDSSNWVIFC